MAGPTNRNRSRLLGLLVPAALAASTAGPAWAQPDAEASEEQGRTSAGRVEEITVRGEPSLVVLRTEAEAARERVYDVFNALNDDDDFDIRCSNESRPGTRVPERICRPRYADRATSRASRRFLSVVFYECTGASGTAVLSGDCVSRAMAAAQLAQGEIHMMDRRLAEEIERVARHSSDLRRAIAESQASERRYEDARERDQLIRASIAAMTSTAAARKGAVVPPVPVELETPEVPRRAAGSAGSEGWVKLRYSILADGTTADARVIDAMPFWLDTAGVVAAAERWTFEPATVDDAAIDWHNNVSVVAFQREEQLLESSPAFAEEYERAARLASDGRYVEAKARNERMRSELAFLLYELGLAQMQLAALESALGNPHAALDAIRRATEPSVPQLADEELMTALEQRFALETHLGRATDALETFERRTELERLSPDDPMARRAAALERALALPETNLAVQARIGRQGRWEYALVWGTFAVGEVDGRVEHVDVECNRNKVTLPFEAEVEMTIPAAWGECVLLFDGRPETTFTLYEFRESIG